METKETPEMESGSSIGESTDIFDTQGVERVSQEKISSISDRFSQLYEIPIEKDKCNFDIYIMDPKVIDEKVAVSLFKEYLGLDIPPRPKDIEKVLKSHDNALGEWLPSKNFGFIFTSVKERFGEKGEDAAISHEVIHAISSSKEGGFVKGSFWSRILSNDIYSIDPRMVKLNEGATELLNIGLQINSTDLNVVKEEFINRLRELPNGNTLVSYFEEVGNLIMFLEVGNISIKELANLYIKGDYIELAIKSRKNLETQKPNFDTCSDEEFDEYMGKSAFMDKMSDKLGIPIIV